MPPHFKRAVIQGVGLLGGSLGMAMRRRGMTDEIVGLGRSVKRLERARQLGSIDSFSSDPAEALKGADALIVCTPPRTIRKSWGDLSPLIAPGTFVTDVGSVKEALVTAAEKSLGADTLFIGSHPMAGSEKSGVEAARSDLFEGSPCFITPTERTAPNAIVLASQFWRAVGCRIVIAHPKRHDELMASISHLPHLAAVALVQVLYEEGDSTPYLKAVVGNGFRDTTRIAAGPADVWEQIFTENSEALVKQLDKWIAALQKWRELLGQRDGSSDIMKALEAASQHRLDLARDPDER